MSADGKNWILLNATPDLRAQIAAVSALQPASAPSGVSRGSPIKAIVLTGAEVDQSAGLLNLRERQPFELYATRGTLGLLSKNPMFDVLASDVVSRHAVTPEVPFGLPGGVEAELFMVPGKIPLYLERGVPETAVETESNVGVLLTAGSARLAFVPGAAAVPRSLKSRLAQADVVLFDGTLFRDGEMIENGTGEKTGRRMGHMPISGEDGSLAALADIPGRRIYIHINNTNPILIEDSPERRQVEAAGWEVAADGLEIVL